MAVSVYILAETKAGKSTAILPNPEIGIKGLDPKTTALVNVMGKSLPVRNWKANFTEAKYKYDPNLGFQPISTGNLLNSKMAAEIITYLRTMNNSSQLKSIVIDDFQYIMSDEFMQKAFQTGYGKFSSIAFNAYSVIMEAKAMRDDIVVYFLSHYEPVFDGGVVIDFKIKTIGKMLDEKITLEGLVTNILFGDVSYNAETSTAQRYFVTNYNGKFKRAATPPGMFKDIHIPNDLGMVNEKIRAYTFGE